MLKRSVGLFLFCCIMLVGGFAVFKARCSFYETQWARAQTTKLTQPVAVVLTGGAGRIEAGLALLRQKRAERLFISGVGPGFDPLNLAPKDPDHARLARCCIDIGRSALDTAGNGLETTQWLRDGGYDAAFFVTSAYHMPRALTELRRHSKDIAITPVTVANAVGLRRNTHEYLKYIAALLRLRLGQLIPTA